MKRLIFVMAVLFFSNTTITLYAQIEKVESGFVYNFTKLIQWPETYRTGDFVIAILGNGPIVQEFNNLAATRKIVDQNIKVVQFKSASDIRKCHLVYITASQSNAIAAVIAAIGNNNTLIITESSGMLNKGSGINFIIVEDKLRYEVNKAAFDKSGLLVNNQLLKMASAVK